MRNYVSWTPQGPRGEPNRQPLLVMLYPDAAQRVAAAQARSNDVLFVGPWIGEFAFEIMNAGIVRGMRPHYNRLVVCSRPGSEPLYADMDHTFLAHDIQCQGEDVKTVSWSVVPKSVIEAHIPENVDVLRLVDHDDIWPGQYIPYGRNDPQWASAIVVHARNRPHVPDRNWSRDRWNSIARMLLSSGAAQRLICIGSPSQSWPVEGAFDARGLGLAVQMDILRSAHMAFGPSSGPMHLAEHCLCPVMPWCSGPERFRVGARYENYWNPFHTPAWPKLWDDWGPPLETVYAWVNGCLEWLSKNEWKRAAA